MTEEAKGTTPAAFEAAMQRCANEANLEPRFDRDVDGNYVQPEMRRALTGWLGAAELVQDQLRGFAELGSTRFRSDAAFQSGFLEYLADAVSKLDLAVGRPDVAPSASVSAVNQVLDEAAFDDAAIEGFARIMKAKMAAGRAAGRGGWWSASVSDLSSMLRSHVDKGDPVDVALLSLMHWYKGAEITPAAAKGWSVELSVTGELTRIQSLKHSGGHLTLSCAERPIHVEGLPDGLTRQCKPMMYEQVELVVRAVLNESQNSAQVRPTDAISGAALDWLTAGHAAHQSDVDLDVIREWARLGEIQSRDDNGTLMVNCASVLARAHRHGMERRAALEAATRSLPIAPDSGADHASASTHQGHQPEHGGRVFASSMTLASGVAVAFEESKA